MRCWIICNDIYVYISKRFVYMCHLVCIQKTITQVTKHTYKHTYAHTCEHMTHLLNRCHPDSDRNTFQLYTMHQIGAIQETPPEAKGPITRAHRTTPRIDSKTLQVITYNTAASACERASEWEQAGWPWAVGAIGKL